MKKLLLFTILITAGTICFAQPTTVKSARTTNTTSVNKASLDKLKASMKQLLLQYNNQLKAAQATMAKIETNRMELSARMKELEAIGDSATYEIQDLMSAYNNSEILAASVQKKVTDSRKALFQKTN